MSPFLWRCAVHARQGAAGSPHPGGMILGMTTQPPAGSFARPLATALQDLLSLAIYFIVAVAVLGGGR